MTFNAHGFDVEYGRHLLARLVVDVESYVVVHHPEPWALIESSLDHPPAHRFAAGDLSPKHLDHLVDEVTSLHERTHIDAVIGLGGGSAMDTAKWIGWRTGLPLYQVPSLPSVNACFTRMTALRDAGGVRYEGNAIPDKVLVDFELFEAAAPELVRGGIGDVLSCHTARFDWQLGAAAGRDAPWDETQATMSLTYLDELERLAPALAAGEEDGIIRLMECHRDIGWRCHKLGHARFEEGSEHFFAYSFEEVTGRTIMHGELVTLGVLIMSAIQGNDPDRPRRIVDAARMRSSLDELEVTWDEVVASLRRTPSFVEEQGLWFSIANGLVVDDDVLAVARRALRLD